MCQKTLNVIFYHNQVTLCFAYYLFACICRPGHGSEKYSARDVHQKNPQGKTVRVWRCTRINRTQGQTFGLWKFTRINRPQGQTVRLWKCTRINRRNMILGVGSIHTLCIVFMPLLLFSSVQTNTTQCEYLRLITKLPRASLHQLECLHCIFWERDTGSCLFWLFDSLFILSMCSLGFVLHLNWHVF